MSLLTKVWGYDNLKAEEDKIMNSVVTYVRLGSGCTIQELLRIKEEIFNGVRDSKLRIDLCEMASSDLSIHRICDEEGCVYVADRPHSDGRVLCAKHS